MASLRALSNFERLSAGLAPESYELEVIDIYANPERAFNDNIVATPTLVKEAPPPRFRMVGDLSTQHQLAGELMGLTRKD
jgi:circadian clock protein KaiB